MRLGVFGGTFDPIHFGHLRAAESARECLELESVLFVPAGQPPHRSTPRASAFDRHAMTCLATAGHARFAVSPLELERPGPSYTVDTLESLHALHPSHELVLLVGADMFSAVGTWQRAARLFELCQLAFMPRPGESGVAPEQPGARVAVVQGPGLAISASDVRARVGAGHSVRYLVPDPVADYLDKRRLYR